MSNITERVLRADCRKQCIWLRFQKQSRSTMTEGIHKLIQSVFNDKILEDMIGNGNETTVPSNDLNDELLPRRKSRHCGGTSIISMLIHGSF